MDVLEKSLLELKELLDKGKIKSETLVKNYFKNIYDKNLDKEVYSYLSEDKAIERAKDIDRRREEGERLGALAGIPLAVSEDISTKAMLTEAGSKILEGYIPPYNATIIDKLLSEDAIIIGKIRISEFNIEETDYGQRALLENSVAGLISSSGSSKGLVKLEASYGLISRFGIVSATSTLSPLYILGRDVSDVDYIFNIVKGHDERDSTSVKLEDDLNKLDDIKEYSLRLINNLYPRGLTKTIEDLGFKWQGLDIGLDSYVLAIDKILWSAEFASSTSRYDGIRYGYRAENYEDREELYKNSRSEAFGREAKKRILFGNYVINAEQYDEYYDKAQRIRSLIREELDEVLDNKAIISFVLSEDMDEKIKNAYRRFGAITGYPMISLTYENGEGRLDELVFLSTKFHEKLLIELAKILEDKIKKLGGEV